MICGVAWNIDVFMVFIFLAGMCLTGFETICLVYISEISGILFYKFKKNKKLKYNFLNKKVKVLETGRQ